MINALRENLPELVTFGRLDRIIALNATEVILPHYGNGINDGTNNGTNKCYNESRLRRKEGRKGILPRKIDNHIQSRSRRDEGISRTDRGKSRRNRVRGGAPGGP
jgi:hypothetical protein